jgi:acyl-CoA thioester hydrolase
VSLEGRVVETELRVRYSETDRMGIVYHGAYVAWFEVGRTEFCRAAGFPYRRMEDDGVWILVTRVECVYRRPARYDDRIFVRARMTELGSRGIAFAYEVVNEQRERVADGASRHVFADTTGKPVRAPAEVVAALERFRELRTED